MEFVFVKFDGLIVISNRQSDMDNRLFHFSLNLIYCLG